VSAVADGDPGTPVARERSRAGNGGRIAAVVIAGFFLLLILAFMVMPFLKHDEARLNAIGPVAAGPGFERGGVMFSGTAGTWEVRGQMVVDAQRRVHFAFDLLSAAGQPAPATLLPKLALDRPERDTPALHPQVSREGPGSYAAMMPLPADGAWRLRIELPKIAAVFLFTVSE
jgi:hypothetical protein